MAESTTRHRARGRYARRRLELGWSPSGRTAVREGPEALVSMVEVAALARAVEIAERVAVPPDVTGDAALGWQAGIAAAAEALRAAFEHQAGLTPPAPASMPAPVSSPYRPVGIDWSQT